MTRPNSLTPPVGSNMSGTGYPFRGIFAVRSSINHGHGRLDAKRPPLSLQVKITGENLVIEDVNSSSLKHIRYQLTNNHGNACHLPTNFASSRISIPNDDKEYQLGVIYLSNDKNNTKNYLNLSLKSEKRHLGSFPIAKPQTSGTIRLFFPFCKSPIVIQTDKAELRSTGKSNFIDMPQDSTICRILSPSFTCDNNPTTLKIVPYPSSSMNEGILSQPIRLRTENCENEDASEFFFGDNICLPSGSNHLIFEVPIASNLKDNNLSSSGGSNIFHSLHPSPLNFSIEKSHKTVGNRHRDTRVSGSISGKHTDFSMPSPADISLDHAQLLNSPHLDDSKEICNRSNAANNVSMSKKLVPDIHIETQKESNVTKLIISAFSYLIDVRTETDAASAMHVCSIVLPEHQPTPVAFSITDVSTNKICCQQTLVVPSLSMEPLIIRIENSHNHRVVYGKKSSVLDIDGTMIPGENGLVLNDNSNKLISISQCNSDGTISSGKLEICDSQSDWIEKLAEVLDSCKSSQNIDEYLSHINPPSASGKKILSFIRQNCFQSPPTISMRLEETSISNIQCPNYSLSSISQEESPIGIPFNSSIPIKSDKVTLDAYSLHNGSRKAQISLDFSHFRSLSLDFISEFSELENILKQYRNQRNSDFFEALRKATFNQPKISSFRYLFLEILCQQDKNSVKKVLDDSVNRSGTDKTSVFLNNLLSVFSGHNIYTDSAILYAKSLSLPTANVLEEKMKSLFVEWFSSKPTTTSDLNTQLDAHNLSSECKASLNDYNRGNSRKSDSLVTLHFESLGSGFLQNIHGQGNTPHLIQASIDELPFTIVSPGGRIPEFSSFEDSISHTIRLQAISKELNKEILSDVMFSFTKPPISSLSSLGKNDTTQNHTFMTPKYGCSGIFLDYNLEYLPSHTVVSFSGPSSMQLSCELNQSVFPPSPFPVSIRMDPYQSNKLKLILYDAVNACVFQQSLNFPPRLVNQAPAKYTKGALSPLSNAEWSFFLQENGACSISLTKNSMEENCTLMAQLDNHVEVPFADQVSSLSTSFQLNSENSHQLKILKLFRDIDRQASSNEVEIFFKSLFTFQLPAFIPLQDVKLLLFHLKDLAKNYATSSYSNSTPPFTNYDTDTIACIHKLTLLQDQISSSSLKDLLSIIINHILYRSLAEQICLHSKKVYELLQILVNKAEGASDLRSNNLKNLSLNEKKKSHVFFRLAKK